MNITEEEYRQKYTENDLVGWDCINNSLKNIYDISKARHYASIIKYSFGGPDPLDGVSIFDNSEFTFHRHMVSYGMSELYFEPECAGKEYSKWGFEFTFRLKVVEEDSEYNNSPHEPIWAINVMQNFARYVFDTSKYFDTYHFIPCNSSIRVNTETKIVGIAFVPDPQLEKIDTPHGEVTFLQMVGLTEEELQWLWIDPTKTRCKKLVDLMQKDNPLLITDLSRQHSYIPTDDIQEVKKEEEKSNVSILSKIKNFFS
ncbi:suppressor of fused domain protein [Actinobacillus porcinus]|uniref:suppressor of fused domain protein n=1 Tax=Actinobacillus porcinus TaxID=51048 RepID=UPI002357EE67|nr:suppressor of fused domain protein [Actinobacillus porcinus]MCI5763501.1 suppressor of fused domain protein [Actinobacillus porcinus]MDY5421762.1 suppressor of fused domain protein [Actinobacillus porcinus]